MKKRLIVSPVGISLFSNSEDKDKDLKTDVFRLNNEKNWPQDIISRLETWQSEMIDFLSAPERSIADVREKSAELNGIYGLSDGELSPDDVHLLIATDTFLGRLCSEILQLYLREKGVQRVIPIEPADLSTTDGRTFSKGIKNLLKELDEQIAEYDHREYEIVFNLTGSFKGMQGYLAIIGMFYADKLVYIFERSDDLLVIPRLPIQIDERVLRENAVSFALLRAGAVLPADEVNLPGALLETDPDGDVSLSSWGILLWDRKKKEILAKELLAFPHLAYTETFRKDFEQAERDACLRLQETLAKVSDLLATHNGNIAVLKSDGGLQYDNYTNKTFQSRPIGHFRVSRGLRVSCVYQNGKLELRRFGKEPEVNDNP